MGIAWLNGEFLPEQKCSVPIHDRGFLFGDGVFTTLKVSDGTIECLSQHLQRLKEQCQQLGIEAPSIAPDTLVDLLRRNSALAGTWRMKIVVTGGGNSHLDLSDRPAETVLLTISPYTNPGDVPLRVGVYPESIIRPVGRIKSLAYIDRLFVRDWAMQHGHDDAVTTLPDGTLLEGAFSNLFWILDDTLYTPDPKLPILSGIALSNVITAAEQLNFKTSYIDSPCAGITDQCHVYTCNVLTGIRKVGVFDGSKLSLDSTQFDRMRDTYSEVVSKMSSEHIFVE